MQRHRRFFLDSRETSYRWLKMYTAYLLALDVLFRCHHVQDTYHGPFACESPEQGPAGTVYIMSHCMDLAGKKQRAYRRCWCLNSYGRGSLAVSQCRYIRSRRFVTTAMRCPSTLHREPLLLFSSYQWPLDLMASGSRILGTGRA